MSQFYVPEHTLKAAFPAPPLATAGPTMMQDIAEEDSMYYRQEVLEIVLWKNEVF